MSITPTAPLASAFDIVPPSVQNEGNLREYLTMKKWPEGLQTAFINNLEKVPFRFFICDDSGSMATGDGKIAIEYNGAVKASNCSRWKELTTALLFHAEVAHRGCIPTEFRFLNACAPLHVGYDITQPPDNYNALVSQLSTGSPHGGTPLCRHINEIAQIIRQRTPALLAAGKKAVIIIATDGEASDGDVRAALRPLKELPVWIILRFCTNEDKIVDTWNRIDAELELNMDVIDDFFGESGEIGKINPWLTYAEPLHRLREFGVTLSELDKIDERLLTIEDFVRITKLIFGPVVDSFPPPQVDLPAFLTELEKANALTPKQFNARTNRLEHWILAKEAQRLYSKGGKCVIS